MASNQPRRLLFAGAAMSALHQRLSRAFAKGHERPLDGLLSDAKFSRLEQAKEAAVLIAIKDHDENTQSGPDQPPSPGVILTQRPTTMRDHPGQVAFPGGKLEPDETPVEAALREAHEELAIDPSQVRIIGETDRFATGTGFVITPVLATIPASAQLTPDPREVESWFEAPLSLLLDTNAWTQHEAYWKGKTREFLAMNYEGYRIWGVTAAICYNLARRLDLQEVLHD